MTRQQKIDAVRKRIIAVKRVIEANEQMREYWKGVLKELETQERTLTGAIPYLGMKRKHYKKFIEEYKI